MRRMSRFRRSITRHGRAALPVLFVGAALLQAPLAMAHGIETEIELSGGADQRQVGSTAARITLHSSFSTGEPAAAAAVRLVAAPGGTPQLLGHTDPQGRLAAALPGDLGPAAEIQVDAGAGHRDWFTLAELRSGGPQAAVPPQGRPLVHSATPLAALGLLTGLLAVGLGRRRG